jgi:hypothetical protein
VVAVSLPKITIHFLCASHGGEYHSFLFSFVVTVASLRFKFSKLKFCS